MTGTDPPLKSYGLNLLSNGVVFTVSTAIFSTGRFTVPSAVHTGIDGTLLSVLIMIKSKRQRKA